jgi:hypothetical protein
MAFYNCKSSGYTGPEWQTAADDFCMHCGEDRWLRENMHGRTGVNRKVTAAAFSSRSVSECRSRLCVQVMYYLPVRHFVQDLFKQADLVPHLGNNSVGADPGSVKASRGWKDKMSDNPVMHGRRDLAFVAQSDGVPCGVARSRPSGSPTSLRA